MQTLKQLEEQAKMVQDQHLKIDLWKLTLNKQVTKHEELIQKNEEDSLKFYNQNFQQFMELGDNLRDFKIQRELVE